MRYKEYVVTCDYIVTRNIIVNVLVGEDPKDPSNWSEIMWEEEIDDQLAEVIRCEVNE